MEHLYVRRTPFISCPLLITRSFSADVTLVAVEYGVSTLGITLFLQGCVRISYFWLSHHLIQPRFGLGPLIWAPLSEVYGRRMAVFPPYFIGACTSALAVLTSRLRLAWAAEDIFLITSRKWSCNVHSMLLNSRIGACRVYNFALLSPEPSFSWRSCSSPGHLVCVCARLVSEHKGVTTWKALSKMTD